MKLTKHFNSAEFACKTCGKSAPFIERELIHKLEKLFAMLDAGSIIVTSGYRCPECSSKVGGFSTDAHTRCIAADIIVCHADGIHYDSDTVAEAAERVGFTGIGIIDDTAVHVDVRNKDNYVNSHWFGDERTGNDNITTFQRGTVFNTVPRETKKLKIMINDKVIYESEV